MPYCQVPHAELPDGVEGGDLESEAVKLFYHTFGSGDTKIVLIMGLAAAHDAWNEQLEALAGTTKPNLESWNGTVEAEAQAGRDGDDSAASAPSTGRQCLAFDNRGIGLSSVPKRKGHYTTNTMATDVLHLMDHVGWGRAHIFGHSMGGMIASKVAALAPDRVLSLALLSVTGGGYEIIPTLRNSVSLLYHGSGMLLRPSAPEKRVLFDLYCHFTQEHLEQDIDGKRRREILRKERVQNMSTSNSSQGSEGLSGHLNAVWTHSLTWKEAQDIISGKFLVSIIHGRSDIIASIHAARSMARKLHTVARMVELRGAHMMIMENPKEVNDALEELLRATEQGMPASEWIQGSTLYHKRVVGDRRNPRRSRSRGVRGEHDDTNLKLRFCGVPCVRPPDVAA